MQQIIGTTVNQVNTAAVIDRKILSACEGIVISDPEYIQIIGKL